MIVKACCPRCANTESLKLGAVGKTAWFRCMWCSKDFERRQARPRLGGLRGSGPSRESTARPLR